MSIHRASPAHAQHWLAIHRARLPIVIACCTTSGLFMTMNDMAGEQFYVKHSFRVSFSVRFRVSDSVNASVSCVVNIMFEIADSEVPLVVPLHTVTYRRWLYP